MFDVGVAVTEGVGVELATGAVGVLVVFTLPPLFALFFFTLIFTVFL